MAFGSKKPAATTSAPARGSQSFVGANTLTRGDLVFSGDLRIDGRVEGNVSSSGKARLVITAGGRVDGNVEVSDVVVEGAINGNVLSSGSVELAKAAKVSGDVHYKVLTMEPSAVVNGNVYCVKEDNAGA